MSATSTYRVHPSSPELKNNKLRINDIKEASPTFASKYAFEKEVKRIIRKEIRQSLRGARMGQMLNSKEKNKFKKCFWFLATIACLVISSYFVGIQIRELFQQNTVLKSSIAQSAEIKVPAVTICPGVPALTNSNTRIFLFKKCKEMNIDQKECETVPFNQLKIQINDMWDVAQLKTNKIYVSVQCPVNELEAHTPANCEVARDIQHFYSFWGKCIVLSPKEKEHSYRGPHSYYNITIEDENIDGSANDFVDTINMYLHNAVSSQNHVSYFRSYAMKAYDFISISVEPKEFKMLSKDLKNCTDTNASLACEDNCFDEKLSDKVKCRLPFMKSTKHEDCKNFKEAMMALQVANEFYRNSTKVTCQKCGNRCHKVSYTMGINNFGPTDNNTTQLLFYYQDSTLETVVQTREYQFNKFLSDVGGILGFFLGFSVLGLLELLQHFVYCCLRFWKKHD